MVSIELDFANVKQLKKFPRHGWAINSQGHKLLWFPIVRHIFNATKINPNMSGGQFYELLAFEHSLQKLTLSLRELHKSKRIAVLEGGIVDTTGLADASDVDKFNKAIEASQLVPLYVDLAYVYLRRLADLLVTASRYVLFENYQSAPRKFKKLRELLSDNKKVEKLKPICDVTLLEQAVKEHSSWFDIIRDKKMEDETGRKGIRDIMEHHPVLVSVQYSKSGDDPWKVGAFLQQAGKHQELISPLIKIFEDFCELLTGICSVVNSKGSYAQWNIHYGDCVMLSGFDEDITGFWPEI